ncbi:hypothetical protein PRIPAC_92213 [Pristionchus pacificus]|uniref:Uncharacterized protein n=1 Tax=Pristionchus pacificus TaxID=54126 RepID=A0A2A6C976_PRIPA|nr:hypothetical protein PRIPAC_92213 [Pristionchus pacificus]|eukprot:PDM74744.1 hypothetical protein PRIPAC_43695 [Pristionchus pacificus]
MPPLPPLPAARLAAFLRGFSSTSSVTRVAEDEPRTVRDSRFIGSRFFCCILADFKCVFMATSTPAIVPDRKTLELTIERNLDSEFKRSTEGASGHAHVH